MPWLPTARAAGNFVVVLGAVVVELLTWGGRTTTRSGGTIPYLLLPALVVAFYSLLLLRRRWPRRVFTAEWVHSLLGLWVPGYQPVVGLLIALHTVASRCSPRAASVALLLTGVPLGIASWNGASTRVNTSTSFSSSFAAQFFLYAVLVGVVWGLGRRAFHSERQNAVALERQAAEAVALVEAERLRLARELHDVVSSAVTAMLLQAAAARAVLGGRDPQVDRSLALVEASGAQAMRELHQLLGLLRQVGTAQRGEQPAQPGLQEIGTLLALAEVAGVRVEVEVEGRPGRLERRVDLVAYRVVQEAFTNVAKHAGRGSSARLVVDWSAGDSVGITLDSVGKSSQQAPEPTIASSGFGLAGLQERLAIVGGSLEHEATPGGFHVCARLPVQLAGRSQVDEPLVLPGPA